MRPMYCFLHLAQVIRYIRLDEVQVSECRNEYTVPVREDEKEDAHFKWCLHVMHCGWLHGFGETAWGRAELMYM